MLQFRIRGFLPPAIMKFNIANICLLPSFVVLGFRIPGMLGYLPWFNRRAMAATAFPVAEVITRLINKKQNIGMGQLSSPLACDSRFYISFPYLNSCFTFWKGRWWKQDDELRKWVQFARLRNIKERECGKERLVEKHLHRGEMDEGTLLSTSWG